MLKKTFITALIVLFVGVNAKSQIIYKIGHINTQELLESMPETDIAQAKLEKNYKDIQKQLELMQVELNNKYQDYLNKKSTYSEAIVRLKESELQDMNARIQQFQASAQEDIEKSRADIYKPILDKANKAIAEVAKENNFTYIFDTSAGAILFQAENSINILPLVKIKLK